MSLPPQVQEARRNRLILLALCVVFYGTFALYHPPLLDDADSVHAEVAREMLLRHDYVTLYANGIRYLEKAPLFYWMMALAMKLFGATTAASRLPLLCSVAGLALVTESFGRRAFGSARTGFYAGLITLSSFGIFIFSRINIPDLLVCFLLTTALFFYLLTEDQERPSRWLCFGFAAALALTLLTKGLIGVVFPVGIVGLHLLATRGWKGAWRRVGQFYPLQSTVLLLVIAAPWHILAGLANPGHGTPGDLSRVGGYWQVPLPTDGNVHGWTWFYFLNEQVYRYLNVRVPHDYDTAPLWLFLGLILVWLMPWSAFLFSAVRQAWPAWYRLRNHTLRPEENVSGLLLIWAALPLMFFSLSTRQEYYVLPSLPPLILLIAALLARASAWNNGAEVRLPPVSVAKPLRYVASGRDDDIVPVWLAGTSARRVAATLAVGGALLSALLLAFLLKTKAPAGNTDLASLLQQNPGDYALSFGHFLDLNAQALGLFRVPLTLTCMALLVGPLAHSLLRRAKRPHAATLSLAGASFLFLFAAHQGLTIFSPTLTSAQLADTIRPQLKREDLLAIHGEYEAGSTLGFYLRRNDIHIVEGRSSNLWYGSFFPDAPKIFETRESIQEKWAGPQRIFLWQDPNDHDRPVLPLVPQYVVANAGGKQILSNQPNH